MARRILGRAAQLLITVWGAVTLVFFASRFLPSDPALILAGPQADEAAISAIRSNYGLDRPLLSQYGSYLAALLTGDLGRSTVSGRPVANELARRASATVELVLAALFASLFISVPLALAASLRPRGGAAKVSELLVFVGTAVPVFLTATLLLYLFYTRLGVAPAPLGRLPRGFRGFETVTGILVIDGLLRGRPALSGAALWHLALPALSLSAAIIPQLLRVLRASAERALSVRATVAARHAGVPAIRFWAMYVLSLAITPTVTLLAGSFGYLLGGAVVVEFIFSWNGLGSWAVNAVSQGDYNVLQGVILVVAVAYAVAYFLSDLVIWWIDPRTLERQGG